MRTHPSALLFSILGLVLPACSDRAPVPPATNATASQPASVPATQPSRDASDRQLATEVELFLETWIVKRDPDAAVAGRLSSALSDERFLPPEAFKPGEYRQRFSGRASRSESAAVAPQEFESAVRKELASRLDPGGTAAVKPGTTAGLGPLLAPFSGEVARETAPELWTIVAGRNPRSLPVAGVPSLAYQVRGWDDLSWTASPTIGYRTALAEIIVSKGLDVQAVVTKLKAAADAPESLIVTLWSDEGRGGTEWRLVGVELPRIY